MTQAQREYLQRAGVDPWSLEWRDARDYGIAEWGVSEATKLPNGRILLANGDVVQPPASPPQGDERG